MPLFLLVNVLFFLFSPVSDFNLRLHDQLNYQFYSDWIRPWVESRIAERGISFEAYASLYWQNGDDVAKSMVLWHVPWLACACQFDAMVRKDVAGRSAGAACGATSPARRKNSDRTTIVLRAPLHSD
jgi:hypothetical protein